MFRIRKKEKFLEKNVLFNRASYQGFVLKRNFWYGKLKGNPVALCGRVSEDGKINFYTLKDTGSWEVERKTPTEIRKDFHNFREVHKEA